MQAVPAALHQKQWFLLFQLSHTSIPFAIVGVPHYCRRSTGRHLVLWPTEYKYCALFNFLFFVPFFTIAFLCRHFSAFLKKGTTMTRWPRGQAAAKDHLMPFNSAALCPEFIIQIFCE
jgi:hypothetical protein